MVSDDFDHHDGHDLSHGDDSHHHETLHHWAQHFAEIVLKSHFSQDPHVSFVGEGMHGTPGRDGRYFHHQHGDFTCALVAQAEIYHEFTGKPYEETKAAVEASQLNLLDTSGTIPDHVGGWLEAHNIPCHRNSEATLADIIRELDHGHKVIIGVNAEHLWDEKDMFGRFASNCVDHAVWLTGVDFTDRAHPKIIINDSGRPDGASNVYDLNEFLHAASDGGKHGMFYVATDQAPPHLNDYAPGFDEHAGFFPELHDYLCQHGLEIAQAGVVSAGGVKVAAGRLRTRSLKVIPESKLPPSRQNFAELPISQRDRLLDNR
jgi:hypothetical protein